MVRPRVLGINYVVIHHIRWQVLFEWTRWTQSLYNLWFWCKTSNILRAIFTHIWFRCYNVFFHNFDIDFIVKIDNIFLFSLFCIYNYLDVYVLYLFLLLEHISILGYYVIKCNRDAWLAHFTYSIYCTHDQLV
jgi:hypothetical protein